MPKTIKCFLVCPRKIWFRQNNYWSNSDQTNSWSNSRWDQSAKDWASSNKPQENFYLKKKVCGRLLSPATPSEWELVTL